MAGNVVSEDDQGGRIECRMPRYRGGASGGVPPGEAGTQEPKKDRRKRCECDGQEKHGIHGRKDLSPAGMQKHEGLRFGVPIRRITDAIISKNLFGVALPEKTVYLLPVVFEMLSQDILDIGGLRHTLAADFTYDFRNRTFGLRADVNGRAGADFHQPEITGCKIGWHRPACRDSLRSGSVRRRDVRPDGFRMPAPANPQAQTRQGGSKEHGQRAEQQRFGIES